jgi:hypothetical protein
MSSLIQILVLAAAISDRDIAHRSGNQSDTFEVGLGNLKLVYSMKEGKLTQYINMHIFFALMVHQFPSTSTRR